MSTNKRSNRWLLLAAHLGTIILMMACLVFTGGQQSDDKLFQFDNGSIEVKDENGNWVPVDGASFELVGLLESTGPWTVAGQEFETSDSTMIDEGLEVGGLVRVRGVLLEDGTWVAYSIEGTDEQTDPIIILIGVVDSVDPWSVNGINLNVTEETDVQGDITSGMIVRVEILLSEDGTWEVISIAPLGESTETTGCVTVVATVLSVSGNEIQFLGWPITVTLEIGNQTDNTDQNNNDDESDDEEQNEDNDDEANDVTAITSGDVVQAVICVSDDGILFITQITILHMDDENGSETTNGEKVLICHKPDKKGGHTLSVASPAVPAHLAHGDKLGACSK
jgi:uncharacterized protein YpmB